MVMKLLLAFAALVVVLLFSWKLLRDKDEVSFELSRKGFKLSGKKWRELSTRGVIVPA